MRLPLAFLTCLFFLPGGPARAGEVPAGSPAVEAEMDGQAIRHQIARLLRLLDSDQFEARQAAAERLEAMVVRPELGRVLATEFHAALVAPDTSLDVRKRLEQWMPGLPRVARPPAESVSGEELDRLVRQLEDDRYAVRLSASKRLEWFLGNAKLVDPILARLKQRLHGGEVSVDARNWLEPVYARARASWLATDPPERSLPPVSDAQIAGWLDAVSEASEPGSGSRGISSADRAVWELRDVLARDAYVSKMKLLLEKRLADRGLDHAARARLGELLDLTRPALVAEYWSGGRLRGIQFLYVGVPSQAPQATRPSHFDSADDRVAHCVSGQNLSPGDYPVGVAIPHPSRPGAMFHLVNLPTPRRRMVYDFFAEIEAPRRLVELSRRTLDAWLAQKRPLGGKELLVVEQLDAAEVSRFAGQYFTSVDDRMPSAEDRRCLAARGAYSFESASPLKAASEPPSLHGILCEQVARRGTREAIPGLLRASAAGRFLPPTPRSPRRLDLIAALAIAARDPWPGADDWLAGLAQRPEPLVAGRDEGPELGATAAAILLGRHRQESARFGLGPAAVALLSEVGLEGYRFVSPEAREQFRTWWTRQPSRGKS